MFYIEDGREHFYQWDLDCRLVVEDPSIKEVHFCNRTDNCSLVCEVYFHDDDFGGIHVVDVPNVLLQTDWKIRVYAYDGKHTKHDACFEIKARTKPSDYVYTETEVKRWDELADKVEEDLDAFGEVLDYVEAEVKGATEALDAILAIQAEVLGGD